MIDIKDGIKRVTSLSNLTEEETRAIFNLIMSGKASDVEMASFLTALKMKGETVDEITGAARAMREKSLKINVKLGEDEPLIDTCGTGGTGKSTFNISTTAAFVVAAAGVKVAKHGNRASSGKCGSADVLEKLGVRIDAPPSVMKDCIEKINIGFLFAPLYHNAMKYAAPVRKEMGIRTIFNILGPLSNPASTNCQVVGVYDASLTERIAEVMGKLGIKRAFALHGENMFDEVTITGRTKISELDKGVVKTYYVIPETFGLKKISELYIGGCTPDDSAKLVKSVLKCEKGPQLDIVLMNSSLALLAAGKVKDLKEGMAAAYKAVESGEARNVLARFVEMTNEKKAGRAAPKKKAGRK